MKVFMWAAVHFFQKPWTIYSKIKIKRARRNTLTGQSSFTGTVRAENNKSQMYLVIILNNVDNLYAKPFRGANESARLNGITNTQNTIPRSSNINKQACVSECVRVGAQKQAETYIYNYNFSVTTNLFSFMPFMVHCLPLFAKKHVKGGNE